MLSKKIKFANKNKLKLENINFINDNSDKLDNNFTNTIKFSDL